MKLVEIRDLDGPNIFLLSPAIKIEFSYQEISELVIAASRLGVPSVERGSDELSSLQNAVNAWLSQYRSTVASVTALETPDHIAIVFPWEHRRFAMAIASALASVLTGPKMSDQLDPDAIRDLRNSVEPDDAPALVRDSERRIPIVGVTGTNGKTTTTRLIAHLVMSTGKHAGWSSSSGVYIDGEEVLSGDYSGPSGARRVLVDPAVDVAILETARGGILLRGIAYESNDVSVFTNISADHLDLQGIHTVEGLAAVKSVVVRVTRPDGTAVLNGDDPLVLSATESITAGKILFSRQPESDTINAQISEGKTAVVADDDWIRVFRGQRKTELVRLSDIPVTFGGRAPHMVENALAAVGAAIGLGIPDEAIAAGLRSFRNSTDQNPGRLNVFDVGGVVVVMDFAHNEVGLGLLIDFSRKIAGPGGKVGVVIGTAGDRTDASLIEIGRVAASQADWIIVKDTKKYLRGRTNEELIGLFQAGVRSTGAPEAPVSKDELTGMHMLLAESKPGDVIAIMCHEQMDEICSWLKEHGTPVE